VVGPPDMMPTDGFIHDLEGLFQYLAHPAPVQSSDLARSNKLLLLVQDETWSGLRSQVVPHPLGPEFEPTYQGRRSVKLFACLDKMSIRGLTVFSSSFIRAGTVARDDETMVPCRTAIFRIPRWRDGFFSLGASSVSQVSFHRTPPTHGKHIL
jgi:hypothetical protein